MFSLFIPSRTLLLTLLFTIGTTLGYGQTLHVNGATGSDTPANGSSTDPFATIQYAIDQAIGGETIVIASGTYAENIDVNKSLTLQGPNVGVAGNGARGSEAIIEPSSQGNAIQISADNVLIDGLQVGVGNVDAAIYQTDHTDITIRNSVINADSVGIALVGTIALAGTLSVNNNLITIANFLTTNTSSLATGVILAGLSGTVDVDLSDNVYSGGAQAILVFGCVSSNVLNITDEVVTQSIRGISVFSFNGVTRASSSLEVNGMSVTNFDEPVSGIPDFPQAGIYFFTDGASTDSHIITATVNNATFSGTGNTTSDYAGIICGDFSSTDYAANLQDITINESTFSDNENRGIQIRGQNTNVSVNRSTFENNGFDPLGTGGNHGFHVVVRNGAVATIANSFFINPASQTSDEFDGLSLQTGSSLTIANSYFDQNGNGTLAGTGGINLSSNYFGTTDESTIATLVSTGNDFTPWIGSGSDLAAGTPGFQPDLSTFYVGTSGQQTGSTGRIDEAIGLVSSGGTVNVNAGSYAETVTVSKAVSLVGANEGTAGNGTRIGETIIDPSSPGIGITIGSANVTINGFQLGTSNSSNNLSTAILSAGNTNFSARNNIIYANGFGITVTAISSGSVSLSDNLINMLDLEDPQNATTPSIGISVSSISGSADIDVADNDISNASYGIGGYALTADIITVFSGGSINGCTQGVAVTNTDGAGNFSRSIFSVEDITMSGFAGPHVNVVAPDAQAGIYTGTFTDGATTTTADSVEVTITGVDISGTSDDATDFAAINIVDFGGPSPFVTDDGIGVNVTITNANLHDNLNRGLTIRGVNATAEVNRSTLSNNNFGAAVASRFSRLTLNNNFISTAATGATRGLVSQTDATIIARQNSISLNGNVDAAAFLATSQGPADRIDLSLNYLGTTDESVIQSLVDETYTDFSPWIASGTDTNPSFAGFQPDLSTLHVGTGGDQSAGGIIQEGHDLVDTLGTVVVHGNSYATDTLDVLKDITLSPLVSLTIDELVTDGGNLTVIDNDLTVTGLLTLNQGVIDLDEDVGVKTDDPVLTITGATLGGSFSDASHIEGKVASDIGAAGSMVFPVGDEGDYRPVTIAPINASTFEVAHYAEAAPDGVGSTNPSLSNLVGDVSTALGPAVIQSALTTRYWNINRTSGTGNANVDVQVLDADMEVEPGTLSVTRLNSAGDWEEITRIGESGGDPIVVTGQTADFSSFSLVSAFGMAPGYVSAGLQMWLKANAGTSTTTDDTDITLWSDMSGEGTDASGTTNFPRFRDNPSFNFNFNPVIVTDGLDDTLATVRDPIADTDDFTLFMVADNENMVTRGATGAGDGWSIKSFSSVTTTSGGATLEQVTGLPVTTAPTIHTLSFDQGTRLDGYRNGVSGTADESVGSILRNSTDSLNIGIDDDNFEPGRIAEVIMYSTFLGVTERERIESYLAVKYGITLPGTYLAADGATIWNHAGYSNDVAGIARDDFSGLDQRKSKSIGDSSLVTIALGSLDAPTAFVNNDAWLMWGNDGGDSTFTAAIDNVHNGTSSRMQRVWRVQETGTVGSVELALEGTASLRTVSLVVHPSDPTFPNDANRDVYEMEYSPTRGDYRVAVDLANGDYFTFAEGPVAGIPAVLISEVIADPERDWSSDNFQNPDPTTGTVNNDDEWIELYVTRNNLNLTNWTLAMVDGDTVEGTLSSVFEVVNYNSLTGGLFQATDSGDFVILGNPNGTIRNGSYQIILRGPDGQVVDQLFVGNNEPRGTGFSGNISAVELESVTRLIHDGDTNNDSIDFVQTAASLSSIDMVSGLVLINEVITDPQRDWSTFGYTGNPPEDLASSGTNDEWIELYILSDGINLSNWTIDMLDGTDRSGRLTTTGEGAFNFVNYISENGGSFTDTRVGDYLVLGDPDQNMLNDINIILRDGLGNIVDQVELGTGDDSGNEAPDGNATNNQLFDEAVARYTNATNTGDPSVDFIKTYATPGATNSLTGIVVINEVVTDPEQDWSTNDFDGTVSGGTISDVDEWVELYIGSSGVNLTNWTMSIEDGSGDLIDQSLSAGGAFTTSSYFGSGSFESTLSGDFLVLGNVTGSGTVQMNNDVQLTLKDADGQIVDQVKLGGGPGEAPNGAASGVADEAIARIPNATDTDNDSNDFIATIATLGRANSTTPVATVGNALDFDGSDDFVSLPQTGPFPLSASNLFTLEMWVKGVAQEDSVIFAEGSITDADTRFSLGSGIGADTDKLRLYIVNDDDTEAIDAVSTQIVFDNSWHHVALVRGSASTAALYIDGVLDATDFNYTVGTLTADNTALGALISTTVSSHFLGQIDELRVWSTARTQVELLENINTTLDPTDASLDAYYRFDHSSGTTLSDLDGSNDGALNNMTNDDWIPADWPVFSENSIIVQSASGNQSTASSGQLSIVNATFLIDNDDLLLVGHEDSDFSAVTTLLPTGTLITNRYARSWHLTKNDAVGTEGGSVTLNFTLGQEPDSSLTYYLLETSDPSTAFEVAPIIGYQPGMTSVDFTVDVDSLTDDQYYTLGWSDAGSGNALDFDDVNDHVVISNATNLDFGSADPFTIEMWLNTEETVQQSILYDNFNASDDGHRFVMRADGSLHFVFADNYTGLLVEAPTSVNDGTWHHCAVTYDGTASTSAAKIYIDGVEEAITTVGSAAFTLANSGTTVYLGQSYANGFHYDSLMDEVRVWSNVRSQQEIIENMYTNLRGDEPNLEAYYRFNQGIGNVPYTLPDLSGNGNVGQLQNFDNLGTTTPSSNYVPAGRDVFEDNALIINTATDILTNRSGELAISSTISDFLQDDGDFMRWGHDGGAFTEVTADLPANSNLTARIARTWHLTKGDINTNDGLVTFAFNLGTPPDPDYTYYLLQRSGSSGDFSITEILGSYPDGDSVKFTLDGSQIVSNNYFTLGRSDAGAGHALDFDGTDDYVSVDDNVDLDITGELTMESWVSLNALPATANEGIVAKYLSAGDQRSYSLEINTAGNLVFNISDDGINVTSLTGTSALATGQITHVAAVYDPGNSMSIYIDGVLDATSTTSIPASIYQSAADLWIGATTAINADSLLNGIIDEVRVWNDLRTLTEIRDNIYRSLDVANEPNLVAYYRFNDGLAGQDNSVPAVDLLTDYAGNDHSGNLNNFTLSGTSTNWIHSVVPLAKASVVSALEGPGNALSFDGVDDHVVIGDAPALDITGALTLEAWVNLASLPAADQSEGIVSKYLAAGNERSYSLEINSAGNAILAVSANGANRAEVVGTQAIATGKWTHVVGVFEPSGRMALYLDGILDSEITSGIPVSIYSSAADVWIGSTEAVVADNAIGATIDEVRIWNVARSTVEIQDNMFKQLAGDEPGLVAYYVFDELDATTSSLLPDRVGTNHGTLTNMADPVDNWVTAASREPFKNLQVSTWSLAATWKSRSVPDATTAISDITEDITLTSSIDVDFININSGVTLTIDAGQVITVNGNLINNGTINGEGTVTLVGSSPRVYGGTIQNLQLSAANAMLMSPTTIAGELDLNGSSTLNIDDFNLTVSAISGTSESAYIVTKDFNETAGYVIKSLALEDGDFTFPIGSGGSYTPLTLKNLGNTGTIQARVFDNTYAQGTSGVIIDTEKEVNKSWEINGDAGVNVTITLQWNSENEDPNFASARSTAYLSKNNYDWWRKVSPDVGATGSDPYQITASGIQTFSVFGAGTENSSLPVSWLAFEAFENEEAAIELHWSTATELNNDRFEIEKSFDGKTFDVIGEVAGNGTTNSRSNYTFLDAVPFNGINYYRLKQVDYDGTKDYSELVSVFVDVKQEYNVSISPNPTFDLSTLSIEWDKEADYAVGVFDMMGRNLGVVHSRLTGLKMDFTALPKGMYIIKINTGDRIIAKKLIKR